MEPPANAPSEPSHVTAINRLTSSVFAYRLLIATFSMLLLVLSLHLLREFKAILQPLFVGLFLTYLIQPLHTWLVQKGIPSVISYGVLLVLIMLALFGLGSMVYRNVEQATTQLPAYQKNLEDILRRGYRNIPFVEGDLPENFLTEIEFFRIETLQHLLGPFLNFMTWLAITFVYLLYVIAEKVSLPARIQLAFGASQGTRVICVIESINQAIAEYVSVKFFVSLLTAVLSMIVLASFRIDFLVMWAMMIFLFNFIPYIGSMIAVLLPILLSLVQLGSFWQTGVLAALLILIQVMVGYWIEPRMTGKKLDVSPLLILLALAFWGTVWGVVGMILAVPLLVTLKIILANIDETKPIAALISNM